MLSSVCCMSLKTYGVVISYLSLILSALATLILSSFIKKNILIFHEVLSDVPFREFIMFILECICYFLVVVNIVSSITMCVGIAKKKHLLMLPWLMNFGLLLLVLNVYFVILGINYILYPHPLSFILKFFIIVAGILALGWFLLYGIYSLFKNIQTYRETPVTAEFQTTFGTTLCH
ncbi:uncharacterized protein LOC121530524 [Drosophila eugracilis]|uniref:uncharacterized protein LOC121530524 n=1 Tax=Drosophila eugracilis TaxID=29029 RepID=UPI001BDB44F9|nr:uncharacterized protein LOC121530524 [Drosophila eugracilis]